MVAKFLTALFLVLSASGASATCYNNVKDIPDGSYPLHPNNNAGLWCTTTGYQTFNGINIPLGLIAGQQFLTMVNGQRQRCTMKDRAASALVQGAFAGALGWVAEKVLNRPDNKVSAGLFVLGLGSGATLTCDPNIFDDDPVQVVGNNSQIAVGQRVSGGVTKVVPGKCNLGKGLVLNTDEETCDKVIAEMTKVKQVPTVEQQTPRAGQQVRSKTYGTVPTVVDGHTCFLNDKAGEILADFFDITKNPKGIIVGSLEHCIAEKRAFMKANGLMVVSN